MNENHLEKMNLVRVLALNPAFIEELEPDGDEVDPADIAPCTSGNAPTVTSPAVKDEEVAGEEVVDEVGEAIRNLEGLIQESDDDEEDESMDDVLIGIRRAREHLREVRSVLASISENMSSRQHTVVPNVDVWDTGKAIEQKYRLHLTQR